jgi:hypothetical protein
VRVLNPIYKNAFYRFLLDDSAQAMTEYLLILSATIFIVSQLGRKILGILDNGILRLGAQLEKDLKTGRAPLDVWEN